jgi:hypothetical protein
MADRENAAWGALPIKPFGDSEGYQFDFSSTTASPPPRI